MAIPDTHDAVNGDQMRVDPLLIAQLRRDIASAERTHANLTVLWTKDAKQLLAALLSYEAEAALRGGLEVPTVEAQREHYDRWAAAHPPRDGDE